MAGFHGPAPDSSQEAARPENARYGLILFFIYLSFYAGFMYLTAFNREFMASAPWGGVNVAVLYGFGLIGAALFLALIYMYLCRGQSQEGKS